MERAMEEDDEREALALRRCEAGFDVNQLNMGSLREVVTAARARTIAKFREQEDIIEVVRNLFTEAD